MSVHIGMLYPGHSGDSDLRAIDTLLGPDVAVHVANTPVPEDSARLEALTGLGSHRNLRIGLELLADVPIASVVWTCTSCGFLLGADGMQAQVDALAAMAGVPASSTTVAMLAAMRALGLKKVAVASPYPDSVAAKFVEVITESGFRVVSEFHWGGQTAAQIGALDPSIFLDWVAAADSPEADAVVVPETAIRAAPLITELEDRHGKPVITANQASVWHGVRLAGDRASYGGLGRLFDAL